MVRGAWVGLCDLQGTNEPEMGPGTPCLRQGGSAHFGMELELFELDRRQHVANTINPAMEAGGIVILDRYYWSSAAYQGARGLSPAGTQALP